ncbi:MAG: hypothetical protein K1X88_21515 [Nannocystaceae bacterium]|nr:hypothetical protein [Nannocystaceae bacterium]
MQLLIAVVSSFSCFAAADPASTATPAPAVSQRGPEPVAPVLDAKWSRDVNRRARGLGLGVRQGLWGRSFAQALHLDVPFGRRVGQFFGLRLEGLIVHAAEGHRYDGVVGGGLGLFGRSPVMGGVVRIYGGGSVWAGARIAPTHEGRSWGVAGGGHLGIEAFAVPSLAFAVEIGGQSPMHALGYDAGPSVMGGIHVYFGR